jgi:hypothetical protein
MAAVFTVSQLIERIERLELEQLADLAQFTADTRTDETYRIKASQFLQRSFTHGRITERETTASYR